MTVGDVTGPHPIDPDQVDPALLVADVGVDVDDLRAAVRRRLENGKAGRRGTAGTFLDHSSSVQAVLQAWASLGAQVALPGTASWPERFATLADPPDLLVRRGSAIVRTSPAVAIVGQRRATPHGREVTAWLADAVARLGITVVSGGARGIDAAAHGAAIDAGGRTTVVLGCGHAVRYPSQHARDGGLFDRVLAGGGSVVSESLPYQEARPSRVLARNRLVAGLADIVVVVEGGPTSGALNTASHAADQGVTVLAVPGDVRAAGSAAPNRLLAEGCGPCRGPDDILAFVGGSTIAAQGTATPDDDQPTLFEAVLPPSVLRVLGDAYPRPVSIDDLASRGGVPTGTLLAMLTRARISGLITDEHTGIRLRRALR